MAFHFRVLLSLANRIFFWSCRILWPQMHLLKWRSYKRIWAFFYAQAARWVHWRGQWCTPLSGSGWYMIEASWWEQLYKGHAPLPLTCLRFSVHLVFFSGLLSWSCLMRSNSIVCPDHVWCSPTRSDQLAGQYTMKSNYTLPGCRLTWLACQLCLLVPLRIEAILKSDASLIIRGSVSWKQCKWKLYCNNILVQEAPYLYF